jgi:hypothetical protein
MRFSAGLDPRPSQIVFAAQLGLEPHDSSQTLKLIVRFKNHPQISRLGFQSEFSKEHSD